MSETSFQLELQAKTLRWLAHGGELAFGLKAHAAKHADVIWSLLTEAVDITDRLPDQERGWLTSGTRAMAWQGAGMSKGELRDIERIRILSGIKPFDGTARYLPQRDDVERALGVLEWMRWTNTARLPQRLSKAAIALARNGDHAAINKIYCPGRKPDRRNIAEIRTRTVGYISAGLKKDLRIVPGPTLSFVEDHNVA